MIYCSNREAHRRPPSGTEGVMFTGKEKALHRVGAFFLGSQRQEGDLGRLNIPPDVKRVLVANVAEDSPASQTVEKKDVILEIDRSPIVDIKDYDRILSKMGPLDMVLLLIYRNGGHLHVTSEP